MLFVISIAYSEIFQLGFQFTSSSRIEPPLACSLHLLLLAMNPEQLHPDLENTVLLPEIRIKPSSSPRFAISSTSGSSTPTATPTAGANRKIAIAVDLSDESAYAVKWAVQNYLRPGDAVVLLHVRPTCVLYGADWGSVGLTIDGNVASDSSEDNQQKLEEEYDAFTSTKASILAQPLVDSHIPYKLHIVKDHDMKERLCLEVERLGLSAVIMGSRGFGASKKRNKAGLGSVSDYCVHHCVCPVVVVRYPEEKDSDGGDCDTHPLSKGIVPEIDLHPVPEEQEYHDASDEQQAGSRANEK